MCIIIRAYFIFARYFCKNIQPETFFPWISQNMDGFIPGLYGSLHGSVCIIIHYAMHMQHFPPKGTKSLYGGDHGGAVGNHIDQFAVKIQLTAQLGRVGVGFDAHARQRFSGGGGQHQDVIAGGLLAV